MTSCIPKTLISFEDMNSIKREKEQCKPYYLVINNKKVIPYLLEEKPKVRVEDAKIDVKKEKEVGMEHINADKLNKKNMNDKMIIEDVVTKLLKQEVKEELIVISDEEEDTFDKKDIIQCIDIDNNYIKKEAHIINLQPDESHENLVPKEELVIDIKNYDSSDDMCIKTEIINKDNKDLYKDHIVLKDIVIGPETIQKVENTTDSSKDIKDENLLLFIKPKIADEHIKGLYKKHYVNKDTGNQEKSTKNVSVEDLTQKVELKNGENSNRICPKCKLPFVSVKEHKCWFICDYCKKCFNQRNTLRVHVQKHMVKNKCRVCGKCFSFASNLARHMIIHSGAKAHKCDQCELTFSRRDYLTFHVQKHHSNIKLPRIDRTSLCELCNKVFSSKCSRDSHMKFSCPLNKNKEKRQHITYTCNVCNKSYPYRTSLKAHIALRHMKRKKILHECDYCGKKYVKKHNLQCHMQSKHLNVKPYPCKFCKETFTWQSCLSTHEKKAHGKAKKKLLLLSKQILKSCMSK